jgi:hypothetical protein
MRLVNADTVLIGRAVDLRPGRTILTLRIDSLHLTSGTYRVALWLANPRSASSPRGVYDYIESAFDIEIVAPVSEASRLHPHAAVTCAFDVVDVAYELESRVTSRGAVN